MDAKSKRSHAIALSYGQGEDIPKIMACGPGEIANKILEIAKQYNIPVRRDDDLLSILNKLETNSNIPPECYQIAAQIFSFLFRCDQLWKKQ